MTALLDVEGLHVRIPVASGLLHPVRDIHLTVDRGETLCIVGESGCGKSLTALAIMGLLPSRARRDATTLTLGGEELSRTSAHRAADIRGNRMAMIFQEPMTSLNPCYTIGNQLEETFLRHRPASRREARDRAVFLLEKVGIAGAQSRLGQYPHQLSGGLRQRVMIAMALMCGPDLIIADEPTTALDVTIQAQILNLLASLQREFGMAMILITHDLGIVARVASRVAVMYAGEIVETGTVEDIFAQPLHPYTQGLLDCIPVLGKVRRGEKLGTIPGVVPTVLDDYSGCAFRGRCRHAAPSCASASIAITGTDSGRSYRCLFSREERSRQVPPESGHHLPAIVQTRGVAPTIVQESATATLPLIEARGVDCTFTVGAGLFGSKQPLKAVTGVDLRFGRGEILGLVGESGCGKSTLARILLGLIRPTAGEVFLDGVPLSTIGRRDVAKRIQPIFQDPYSSLNPRRTIEGTIALPLKVHKIGEPASWRRRVEEMMDLVGLSRRFRDSYPNQLSGGQRQRVAIARALVIRPEVVICDEPTSSLDVSVQSQILNLLLDLRRELGLSYLLITHNLAVVELMASRVAVMYLGRIVEENDTDALFREPKHPYTQALLSSILTPEPGRGVPDTGLGIAFPNPLEPPPGCAFHPRCSRSLAECRTIQPRSTAIGRGFVACNLYGEGPEAVSLPASGPNVPNPDYFHLAR